MKDFQNAPTFLIIFILGLSILFPSSVAFAAKEENIVLKAMESEITHSMKILTEKGKPAPYYISYRITDNWDATISGAYGSLKNSSNKHSRLLDVDVRVGDYSFDNSHTIRGDRMSEIMKRFSVPVPITIEDDPDVIKSALWNATDQKYKSAVELYIKVSADKKVNVKEEDQSDDFTKEKPQKYIGAEAKLSVENKVWEENVKAYSAIFNQYPEIYNSSVNIDAQAENKYFVSSEGTTLQQGRTNWRLTIFARTKAEDGMDLYKGRYFDAHSLDKLPDDKTIRETIHQVAKDLVALKHAPVMEPFTGPAILAGGSSGVFFHEIFGHRIEGHRQKDEDSGQTFTKKVNTEILPDFISIYDDPTLNNYEQTDLNGYYLYDDEGVKAERVTVVDKGVLKNFLMSRSPIKGFPNSNGHGRAEAGKSPVSRQGNLIVESSKTVSNAELRSMLLAECKKQEKPYGLIFYDVTGGFTFTGRGIPNAFNVTPVTVFRAYVDGRPDELVRGVDLIGTPLTSFSKIIACGDTHEIFNGYCGAESGRVPVSAISPSVLTTQIEVQKKYKASDKPPVLAPPARRKK